MVSPQSTLSSAAVDTPVVLYLQQIWQLAAQLKASDIHFEPFENFYRVRLRIDGVLQETPPPPFELKDQIASCIKVLSRLDIAEKRLPQDGRMNVDLENMQRMSLRVSTLPTLFGEKLVLRVVSTDHSLLQLAHLGYGKSDQNRLIEALEKTHGMILVTGPTGSGKSQSLYACLNLLNRPEVNIATVEDPSEIHLAGVNQLNVKEKIGLNFASALRAFLRQDPDILMVGEIRDSETADIAMKASQTGHLVLTTLHTQDAPSALIRLRNMGIANYNLASSLSLISAQRLVRRLCVHCKKPMAVSDNLLKDLGWSYFTDSAPRRPNFFAAVGCSHCHQGYRGRLGLFQVMPVTHAMQDLVLQNSSRHALADQAQKEGITTLRQTGLRQAFMGITSLSEVLAHTDNP